MKTDKKTGIIYRQWDAVSPKAVLLLVHGLGAHSGRWEFLSDFFLKHRISSYALELKGFGETKDLKGYIDSFDTYLNDIRHLYNIILKKNPQNKIFLLGESMGALISFLVAVLIPDLFDGFVFISPAFASRLKFSFSDYVKIGFSLFSNPKRQFKMPFNSQSCTRDVNYQRIMNGNHREHRLATSKLLLDTAIAQMRSKILKNRIKMPVLFLLAGKDELVDSDISKKVFKDLRVKDKTIIFYPDMFHALSIELGRERVFEDILKWVEKRI